jgi:hypothetical protein
MNKQALAAAFVMCLVSVSSAVLLASAPAVPPAGGDLWQPQGVRHRSSRAFADATCASGIVKRHTQHATHSLTVPNRP